MKEVVSVAIGNKSFTLETDAYTLLKDYLEAFRTRSSAGIQSDETMSDIEERIAEILSSKTSSVKNVVNIYMIEEIIARLGMPDGTAYTRGGGAQQNGQAYANQAYANPPYQESVPRKFYRDVDSRSIGGVCSGLGYYLNIDPTILKVIFVVLFLIGGGGLLIYIILWIVAPPALTPVQKCEMRGWPLTAENIEKFTRKQ
ncbi:MAG: PspC domain-containing protein [Bacteroidales bacterium]|nr:PspC domain-containing protein [Bacteroidales bacterium]MBR6465010.1 PspC domain-containing protein [Bacteroidales bacterium]